VASARTQQVGYFIIVIPTFVNFPNLPIVEIFTARIDPVHRFWMDFR